MIFEENGRIDQKIKCCRRNQKLSGRNKAGIQNKQQMFYRELQAKLKTNNVLKEMQTRAQSKQQTAADELFLPQT